MAVLSVSGEISTRVAGRTRCSLDVRNPRIDPKSGEQTHAGGYCGRSNTMRAQRASTHARRQQVSSGARLADVTPERPVAQ
jgi:hypothetical protein